MPSSLLIFINYFSKYLKKKKSFRKGLVRCKLHQTKIRFSQNDLHFLSELF